MLSPYLTQSDSMYGTVLVGEPSMSQLSRPPRFKFAAPVEFEWGSATVRAFVRDISANGLFIEMTDPLWIGATFSASLNLSPPLHLYCTVHRIDPSRGMAVRVAFANKENEQRFSELVQEVARK